MFSTVGLIADNEEADGNNSETGELSQMVHDFDDKLDDDDDDDDEIPDYPESGSALPPFDELPEAGQTAIKKMIFETAITAEAFEEALSYVKLVKDDDNYVFEVSRKKYVGEAVYSSEGAAAEMTDLVFIEGLTAEDIIDISENDFRAKFGMKTSVAPIQEEEEEDDEVQSPKLMMLQESQEQEEEEEEEEEEEAVNSSSAKKKKRKKKGDKSKSTKRRKTRSGR